MLILIVENWSLGKFRTPQRMLTSESFDWGRPSWDGSPPWIALVSSEKVRLKCTSQGFWEVETEFRSMEAILSRPRN